MRLQHVACADIVPSALGGHPPREVEALADDIRAQGILRPLLLRQTAQGYVIVHGERRWQAAKLVGLSRVPAFLVQDFPWTHFAPTRHADGAALDT